VVIIQNSSTINLIKINILVIDVKVDKVLS